MLIREKLDIPLPQVKIEARMEILARNDLFALGVQWGGGGVATGNQATLVGRGFTSQVGNTLTSGGIPASGLGTLPNPNLNVGSPGVGTPLPVSSHDAACRPAATSSTCRSARSCRASSRRAPPASRSASSAAA